MVERKGRRYCRICATERQKRWLRQKTLDALEAERQKALAQLRELDADDPKRAILMRFAQRTEDRMTQIDDGGILPRQHRKWVAKVNRHDGVLCAACEARVFPFPKDTPSVEMCPE